jgi:hypothetical protein
MIPQRVAPFKIHLVQRGRRGKLKRGAAERRGLKVETKKTSLPDEERRRSLNASFKSYLLLRLAALILSTGFLFDHSIEL